MEISLTGIIILVLTIIFFYCLYLYDYYSKIDTVISTFDNKTYEVQKKHDSEDAANLIAKIREKVMILVEHLKSAYPSDQRTDRIIKNFRPDKIKEGMQKPGVTSYSINKGEQIVLCLRTNNKLMDINTMMFVILHELAHIATISVGHTDEFWENFKWILEEAINIGIYTKQDFKKEPIEYCGMDITSSPLD
jgi:predicted metal-dependent hydrolase